MEGGEFDGIEQRKAEYSDSNSASASKNKKIFVGIGIGICLLLLIAIIALLGDRAAHDCGKYSF